MPRRLENGKDVLELEKARFEQKQFELKRDRQRQQYENAATASRMTSPRHAVLIITIAMLLTLITSL